ncbi:GDSL esterase/lipase At1g31550-like isoform X2 [Magnolia sinica]|uniref:GDSL esterase/lipase At1g31550-like isoform X2 n=1 Tax=Magnolia sinica TaxID=86752 RepID=UPI00265AA703|nr:GDSL esterase/lipase At1g31550-like isoform X2 [Magnolia sinica]
MAFSSPFIFFNLSLLITIFLSFCGTDPVSSCYTSIFSFGDSLTDTGNYLYIYNSSNIGNFPYGETYFHHPTGRCSDGRVLVDFIEHSSSIWTSFASTISRMFGRSRSSAGSEFCCRGGHCDRCRLLRREEDWRGDCKRIFGRSALVVQRTVAFSLPLTIRGSLFLVGEIGINDYFYLFNNGSSLEVIRTYVPQVVSTIGSAVHTLIERGAMTLVVPGGPPIGCSALILTIGASLNKDDYDKETGCLKRWNELVQYHNDRLQIELDRMRDLHPHATIIYADYYNAAFRVFRSPLQFGFSKGALSACCGAGGPYNYNSSFGCGTHEARVCKDPSLYFNWDGGHPTEAGHRLIADAVISGPYDLLVHACH